MTPLGGTMICGYCGAEVSDQRATFCARCGRALEHVQPAVLVPANPGSSDLYGVRGWLLILCIFLAVAIPLLTAYNWSKLFAFHVSPFPWFSLILSIVMALFSFFAGISLWTIRSNAVRIAKAYFIAEMVMPFLFGARLLIEITSGRVEMSPWNIFAVFVRPILMGLIGYFYLARSKRVHATYGDAASYSAVSMTV